MLNMGMGEILVILLIALMIFGPNKLPEIARNLGKAIRAFQAEGQKAAAVLRSAVEDEQPRTTVGVIDRPDPPSTGDALAEPAPEGTERISVPDGPVRGPRGDEASASSDADGAEPMDHERRLLEDT